MLHRQCRASPASPKPVVFRNKLLAHIVRAVHYDVTFPYIAIEPRLNSIHSHAQAMHSIVAFRRYVKTHAALLGLRNI